MVIAVIGASMVVRNNYSMLSLGNSVPQFDVSFPEKLLKNVAARGEIFSLKFTKYHLAARLCQDPLWGLKPSPNPLAAIMGAYF